jgi:hypothetical protein
MTLKAGLSESSGGRIRISLSISFHHGSCPYVTCGMKGRPVGGRGSETWFHTIDIIIIIIIKYN